MISSCFYISNLSYFSFMLRVRISWRCMFTGCYIARPYSRQHSGIAIHWVRAFATNVFVRFLATLGRKWLCDEIWKERTYAHCEECWEYIMNLYLWPNIALRVILNECGTWFLPLRQEHRLRMFVSWGEYLDRSGMKSREGGNNCRTRRVVIFTLCQV
jgi:hypothetical protein